MSGSNVISYTENLQAARIAVIGLGYVGLPLAAEFGKHRSVVGFDINERRISELKRGFDATLEVSEQELSAASSLVFTRDVADIIDIDIYIITVPTPVDDEKKPDLAPLIGATEIVGSVLSEGNIVIYESTVYPGATEEDCVPILEKQSQLLFNKDFFCGYSPERINPGDRDHRLPSIVKVTSGSTPEIAEVVDQLYNQIIVAGTHKAESIRVAEAAKVIENTQRDVNIALINELAMLFGRLGIDTEAVLQAAGTKWNFLPFRPGLVGGHCIGVDPYYLTEKAIRSDFFPRMILSGREINDGMAAYIAGQIVSEMELRGFAVRSSKILIMGVTFKEDCPDLRNSKVFDMIRSLQAEGPQVEVFDPWITDSDISQNQATLINGTPCCGDYDAIVVAVAHSQFKRLGVDAVRAYGKDRHLLFDIKNVFPAKHSDWRL